MRPLVGRVVWALLAVLVVAGAWTAVVLLSVRADVAAARADLLAIESEGGADAAADRLSDVRERLDRVRGRLAQPGPRLIASLPLAGRTLVAAQTTVEATHAAVVGAIQVIEVFPEDSVQGGRIDVDALRRVADATEQAARRSREPMARLRDLELGFVPVRVANGVREARERLLASSAAFAKASHALAGLTDVLGSQRPRSMLVMLQNNAELRGTGGLVTVFAEAKVQDGQLAVGAFRDVEDVADPPAEAVRVDAPADYQDLWAPFLANTTLWVNVNMTPDVPVASQVLGDIAAASGIARPDAVLWVDVRAIASLLGATGPVRLPNGTELTEQNALRTLLSDAYASAPDSTEGQAARREALRSAADAVLGRLLGGGVSASPPELAAALAEAAAGRHLALWTADDAAQAELVAGGLAGDVSAADGDLSSVALQNFGGGDDQGNKLDYYARRQVTVRVSLGVESAVVEQEISLRNTAPSSGLPTYVSGRVDPGTTRNYVALALPHAAEAVTLQRGGRAVAAAPRPAGDHAVVTDGAALAPGSETTWLLRYRLPVEDGRYRLRLVPQPLAVDAGLRLEVSAADGRELRGEGVADGQLVVSGPYDQERLVELQAVRPGLVARGADAVRRFWSEPVKLPW